MFSIFNSNAEPLATGDNAPQLSVTLDDGSKVDLADYYAKGLTFVFFYPMANTPGCTAQACSLRDDYDAITKHGINVFGVSVDNVDAQKKFRSDHSLPYPLIADTDKQVINAFGVPAKLGFAARQAYLVSDGKIVWRDLKASTKKQAEDLLAFVKDFKAKSVAE